MKKRLLEGMLFIVGSEGIEVKEASEFLNLNKAQFVDLLTSLEKDYENEERPFKIHKFSSKIKLVTKEIDAEFYENLTAKKDLNMTPALLEVLAIVFYKGPLTVREIDEIRGLSSRDALNKLKNRDLVIEAGRTDLAGRGMRYKVSDQFLDYFGIDNAYVTELVDVLDSKSSDE